MASQHGAVMKVQFRFETSLGDMIALCDEHSLFRLYFADHPGKAGSGEVGRTPVADQIAAEVTAYFSGNRTEFSTPCATPERDFSRQVWQCLRKIPYGETRSYAQIARLISRPTAVRAVARVIAANPLLLIVPCHRVVGANGALTGYSGGLERKQKLLELEHCYRHDDLFADVRTADSMPGK